MLFLSMQIILHLYYFIYFEPYHLIIVLTEEEKVLSVSLGENKHENVHRYAVRERDRERKERKKERERKTERKKDRENKREIKRQREREVINGFIPLGFCEKINNLGIL